MEIVDKLNEERVFSLSKSQKPIEEICARPQHESIINRVYIMEIHTNVIYANSLKTVFIPLGGDQVF